MTQQPGETYFDLHITGLGYLNRAREIPMKEGQPLLTVDLSALHGRSDRVRKTRFDCIVVGKDAQRVVRRLMPRIALGNPVLVGFRLSGLRTETFVYQKGERQGETGISLKANLIKIAWVKIDGKNIDLTALTTQKPRRREQVAA